ncbi:hypothetical protein [Chitinimonas lacunae]|uniref:Energy transducer TonB n=1 Tax=Chitinimonas lacunae TaxID=1963018 RepID=A0ABV8MN10_9NEIS
MAYPALDPTSGPAPLSLRRVAIFLGLSVLVHGLLLLWRPPEPSAPPKPGLTSLQVQLQRLAEPTVVPPPPPAKRPPPPPPPKAPPRKHPPPATERKKTSAAPTAPPSATPAAAPMSVPASTNETFTISAPAATSSTETSTSGRLDLEGARQMARDIDRNRRDKPAPGHPALAQQQSEQETAMARSINKAARPDCREAYAGMGLLAAPMLIKDGVTDKGCKW